MLALSIKTGIVPVLQDMYYIIPQYNAIGLTVYRPFRCFKAASVTMRNLLG